MDRKQNYDRTHKHVVLQKSIFVDDSLINASSDELVDKINAVSFKNLDKLQLVNNNKLMGKSNSVVSSLLNNDKEKCQGYKIDVLFRTWKGAVDELIG